MDPRRQNRPDRLFPPETASALTAGPVIHASVEDESLIAYAMAADPVFTNMRALIGQLSGILILAQTRRCRDVGDLPDIAVARERWGEVVEHLGKVTAPQGKEADLGRLREAVAQVERAISVMTEMRPRDTDESVARASSHLKRAYRLMQQACDHRLGLAMVDQSGACCSCGASLSQ
ncbi:MAG: hypothetical protein KDJ88_13025 [Bauldia sp.]|nr:hypothetical protein [Bauldia sp.]